eukprot:TRINITY_DN4347_c0_g1_i1.p4 TRINITY_DN4347_c0_g1~~TRINITY_DN4347_c0_g1_i1.p4  ORF type:complete len:123 (+),score=16.42 TRINITY_DN4347_c0_g1_i1:167-535(+)
MGKPGLGNARSAAVEHIGRERGTRGTETSKYPEEKRLFRKQWRAKAEEPKPLRSRLRWGCRTNRKWTFESGTALERSTEEGESPVGEIEWKLVGILSTTEHVNSVGNWEAHLPRLNTLDDRQ